MLRKVENIFAMTHTFLLHSSSGQLGVDIMCDKCIDYLKAGDNDS